MNEAQTKTAQDAAQLTQSADAKIQLAREARAAARARNAEQSTFVTVIGCISMGLGVLGLLGGLAQAVMMPMVIQVLESGKELAFVAGFFRQTMWASLVFNFVVSAFLTWSSWALIQRQNWARIAFVVMAAIGALVGLLFASVMLFATFGAAAQETAPMRGTLIALLALALVHLGVSVWVMMRLTSAPIRAEFDAVRADQAPRSLAR